MEPSGFQRLLSRPEMRVLMLVLLLTPPAVVSYHQVQTDDPYITYRYARNLIEGRGFVYNAGEQVLGTTAPLYALVLALGGGMTNNYPLLSSILSGIGLAALSLLIYRILALLREALAGGIAAVLVVLNPLMGDAFGFELNCFLALIFGAYLAHLSGRPHLAALLLGLGTLTRGDGLVPAGLIFLSALWTQRRFPRGPALIYGALVGSWSAYAIWTFGSPFPNTLAAKQFMGESGLWRPYWYGALRMAYLYLQQTPLYLFFGVAAGLGCVRLRQVDRRIWLLLGWAGLIFAAYSAMGIPAAANYFAALMPFLMIVCGLGAVQLKQALLNRWPAPRWKGLLPLFLAAPLLAASLTSTAKRLQTHPEPRYWTYRETGEWLAAETPAGTAVGLAEIGIVGYFSERPIVDICGLVSPAVGTHLAAGDPSWPIRTYRPDYVLLHDPVWPALEGPIAAASWFQQDYAPVRKFAGEEPYRLVLYQKIR